MVLGKDDHSHEGGMNSTSVAGPSSSLKRRNLQALEKERMAKI